MGLSQTQREAIRAFAVERADELGELAIDKVLAERPYSPNRAQMRHVVAVNQRARRRVADDLYRSMLGLFERGEAWRFDDFDDFKAAVRSGEFHDWESLK